MSVDALQEQLRDSKQWKWWHRSGTGRDSLPGMQSPNDRDVAGRGLGDASNTERVDEAYREYCKCLERGEIVDTAEFCGRFPDVEPMLRQQIEIHHVVLEDQFSLFRECCSVAWPQAGERLVGFNLLELLGQGAFSRVFLAEDTNLGNRQVVVKVCNAGSHEAWILGKLEHDNIVPIHSVQHDIASGLSLICMPYLGRTTVRDFIESAQASGKTLASCRDVSVENAEDVLAGERRKMASRVRGMEAFEEEAILIALRVAEALCHAHDNGVLHLDLKPSNILVPDEGGPKILDFNLASDPRGGVPRIGGTLPYMSPEQARCFLGETDACTLDKRSDIFSFGVVLFELLCHQLPYGRVPRTLSSHAVAKNLLERQVQGLPAADWDRLGIRGRLREIIERCLASDPDARYDSASILVEDLKSELTLFRKTQRRVRAHPRLAAAIAVVAICLTLAGAVALAARDPYVVRQRNRGVACLAAGEYQRSVDFLTNSLEVDPEQPVVLFARARAFVAKGNYHSAIRDLLAADKLHHDAQAFALMGYCCNRVRSHAEAASYYQKSIDLGFSNTAVYNNMGFSYFLRARYDEAIKALNVAVQLGDSPSITLCNRAMVWRARAERRSAPPTEALRDIEMVVERPSSSASIYYRAASIYAYATSFDQGWREQALKCAGLALDHGTPPKYIKADLLLAAICEKSDIKGRMFEKNKRQDLWQPHFFLAPLKL